MSEKQELNMWEKYEELMIDLGVHNKNDTLNNGLKEQVAVYTALRNRIVDLEKAVINIAELQDGTNNALIDRIEKLEKIVNE